jgi:hypothetical protein
LTKLTYPSEYLDMKIKILGNRILGFMIWNRRKTESGLVYRGQSFSGDYSGVEEFWPAVFGKEVHGELMRSLKPGMTTYINDGFEPELIDDMWHNFKDLKEFKELKDLAETMDGTVVTALLRPSGLLAYKE